MYDNYADSITLEGIADGEFLAWAAACIAHPTGPFRVEGGPGTGKSHAITSAARQAGYSTLSVDTQRLLSSGDVFFVASALAKKEHPVVLLVETASDMPRGDELQETLSELRKLAADPKVRATFVVNTVFAPAK